MLKQKIKECSRAYTNMRLEKDRELEEMKEKYGRLKFLHKESMNVYLKQIQRLKRKIESSNEVQESV